MPSFTSRLEKTTVRPSRTGTKWRLSVISGPAQGQRVEFDDAVTIGRAPDCDLVLEGASVWRSHCRIFIRSGQVYLTDLASTNGVTVNGKPCRIRLLQPGDEIQVGDSVLTLRGPTALD